MLRGRSGEWPIVGRSETRGQAVDKRLTAAGRLDCSDVDLFHVHHGLERALSGSGIGIGDGFRQSQRRNLPRYAPFVLAPAARAFLAAIADNRVPVAVGFLLVG